MKSKTTKEGTINPYKVSWFDKIPFAVKALIIKYWFFGCLYFFFVMGLTFLANDSYNPIIQLCILGVATGLFNEFLVDNILEVLESGAHEAHYWWFFKSKKWWSVFINVVYGFVVAFISEFICAALVSVIPENSFGAFREPLTFGLVALLVDGVFVSLKDVIVLLWKKRSGGIL